jgi:hypothetical protein
MTTRWPHVVFLVVGLMLSLSATNTSTGQTGPSCSYLHETRPASKYAFTQATIIALSYARSALREGEALETERKAERNPQTLITGMMRHIKSSSEFYVCAERVLEPYKKSPDQKMIGDTAEGLAVIYRQHVRLNDQFLEMLRNLPDLSDQPIKRADMVSTIQVEREKLGTDLINATTLTLLGLLDSSKPDKDGKLRTLLITRAERKELLDRVLRNFPKIKYEADKSGTSALTFVTGLYYTFLTKQYKCADE